MKEALLVGLRVIDLAGEPAALTGRILADLGADVIKLEAQQGDPLRQAEPLANSSGESLRFHSWNAGKRSVQLAFNGSGSIDIEAEPKASELKLLLSEADVILETPGFTGALELAAHYAPQAVWLKATPFGLSGPRSTWQASDLGIIAASGNLFVTGFSDRGPLRCTEPASYVHAASEAAYAVLTALASGRAQVIDLAMQEVVMVANMGAIGQFPKTKKKGLRMGAHMGRTREIWPCKDGFVSFGLRGGPARVRNFDILIDELKKADLLTPAWLDRDWTTFNAMALSDEELQVIEAPLHKLFMTKSMAEWYELAAATNLMLASTNSAKEIYASEQIKSRDMFGAVGSIEQFPKRFMKLRSCSDQVAQAQASQLAPQLGADQACWLMPNDSSFFSRIDAKNDSQGPWAGLKIVEFGAGAAGPIASRYFAEQGATVIKVESKSRPEFLRMMAINTPHKLEGSNLFDALNPGKYSITLNLKTDAGKEIAKRLIFWADAVQENFAPKGMRSFGLDYDSLVQEKPDLVMLSTCLNGQTGPHRDYPGFGGQGAALSGYNFLTGWPDSEPVGPYGTITDSLAPRFCAAALAAAIFHHRRRGNGVHLDISQVEAAAYCLSPRLLDYAVNGKLAGAMGNRSRQTAPHGVFPCQDEDTWVSIASWNEAQWHQLAEVMDLDKPAYDSLQKRFEHQDQLEKDISAWTGQRSAQATAEQLQDLGIEAVPVASFEDAFANDPQLWHRQHFLQMQRPVTGLSHYERNGFRLSESPSQYARHSPTLGENNDEILLDMLGYSEAQVTAFKDSGAVE